MEEDEGEEIEDIEEIEKEDERAEEREKVEEENWQKCLRQQRDVLEAPCRRLMMATLLAATLS